MAANIGECMEEHGVNFIGECVPIRRQKVEDGSLGKLKVQSKYNHVTEFVDEFNKIWLEGVQGRYNGRISGKKWEIRPNALF